jgi:hypothetical protein
MYQKDTRIQSHFNASQLKKQIKKSFLKQKKNLRSFLNVAI